MNIYEINNQILALVNNADIITGEIDIEQLEGLELAKKEKQENIVKYIRHLELDEQAIKEETKRLNVISSLYAKRQESLKKYLKSSMELDQEDKLDLGLFKVSIAKNPPAVVIEDEDKLDKYKKEKVQVTIDKAALKEDLKNGEVAGARLEQSTRLVIK